MKLTEQKPDKTKRPFRLKQNHLIFRITWIFLNLVTFEK